MDKIHKISLLKDQKPFSYGNSVGIKTLVLPFNRFRLLTNKGRNAACEVKRRNPG